MRILRSPLFWLVGVALFNLFYFFAEHEGLYHQDDYSYALFAHRALAGDFCFTSSVFCHRFLVYLPTSLFYALLGAGPYTTTFWPLLCTLGTYLLLYFTFRKKNQLALSWALVLLGLFYFLLNTINYLYPDNILLFFTTACLLLLYQTQRRAEAPWHWGLWLALLGFGGFLVKETVVYFLPFCLLLLFADVRHRRNLGFWLTGIGTIGLLMLGYFGLYHLSGRSAWARFEDIEAYSQVLKAGYLQQTSATHLLKRLTYQPLLFFIGSGMAVPLAFLVGCLLAAPASTVWRLRDQQGFWLWALVALLLPIWFGSVSLDHYKPMSLLPRMFHPIFPAFCLSAGLAVEKVGFHRKSYGWLAAVFFVCAALAQAEMKVFYLPFAVVFGLAWAVPRLRETVGKVALPLVAAVLLIRPSYFILKPSVSNYFAQKKLMEEHLPTDAGPLLLLSDRITADHLDFFYGFEVPPQVSFSVVTDTAYRQLHQVHQTYLIINNGLLTHPEIPGLPREKDLLRPFPAATLVAQEGKVKLYLLPKNP